MDNIRVLLADDDPIIREGLARLLNEQEGLVVVATAADGAQAIDQLHDQKVDLALLDVDMPVMSGIEAAKRISQDYSHIVIVMLTVFEHEDSLGEAIGAGVRGFLTKDIIAPELAQLIRKAYSGQQVRECLMVCV
ncbi:response regulator [Actinotignum timonense]|uniref:response regulator n=1 Tax=Actinotignum timonense TaxID=1870995 RepID=UPI00254EF5BF|nr:response regulator transcription factor [Actinotignum timonense]MDK8782505.1 response regulator transcription factor [Actinotignum timonense]